jgi:hypothetical protein
VTKPDMFDVFVCVDCGFYLANGLPDETEQGWSPELIDARWKDYQLVNGDSEKDHDFSWTPCEGCGSPLGGARMHCVAWECKATDTEPEPPPAQGSLPFIADMLS